VEFKRRQKIKDQRPKKIPSKEGEGWVFKTKERNSYE